MGVVLALMIIWPIPHTISLRYALIVLALVWLGSLAPHGEWALSWKREFRTPVVLFALLLVWMLLLALFGHMSTAWSLNEISSQWLPAALAAVVAVLLAERVARYRLGPKTVVAGVILLPVFVHLIVIDSMGLLPLWSTGILGKRIEGMTSGPDKSSYLTNLAIALLLAEFIVRLTSGRRMLAGGKAPFIVMGVIAFGGVMVVDSRNGFAAMTVLLGVAIALLMWKLYRVKKVGRMFLWLSAIATVLIMAGLLVAGGYAKPGASWQRVIATIPVALQTDRHREWLHVDDAHRNFPTLDDGTKVDGSAFLRIAWMKEGIVLIKAHPLGVGYGRNVFGHQIAEKYGVPFHGHSHSSVVDLGIGIGVPGLLLWFGLLLSLCVIGWRRFWTANDAFALALLFVTFDYGVRSFVDSNVRDHMLQQFVFVATLLAVLAPSKTVDAIQNDDAPP